MKIKDKAKYSKKLIDDVLFVKRKLLKLGYLLEDNLTLLETSLSEVEALTYDIADRLLEEE